MKKLTTFLLTIGLLLPVTSAWANETKKAQPTKASAQEFIKINI